MIIIIIIIIILLLLLLLLSFPLILNNELNKSLLVAIGGLKPISRETDNSAEMYNCWLIEEEKELMRDLLFSSTNMAAMT